MNAYHIGIFNKTILIDYVKIGRTGRIKCFSITACLFNTLAVVKANTYLQDLYISSRLFTGLHRATLKAILLQ